jgi:apolipoprotein N-acyltransferase
VADAEPRLSRIETWFASLAKWRAAALSVAAGAVAALGYAPLHAFPAYVIGLVALVWLLDAARNQPRRARSFFWRGWLWGLGHFLAGMYWIAAPFMVDPDSYGLLWAVPCTLVFAGGLAVFFGAGAALAAPFWTHDLRRLAVLATALALTEYARGNILTGFPWNLPAYVWAAGGPVSQIAAFVGVYGLSALTLLIAAAPAAIADGDAPAGRRFAPVIVAALVIGLAWGAGANRLTRAPYVAPGETPIVRVADSGLGQAEKWTYRPDQEWRVLARYLQASGAPEESHAQIVVWPEGAIPTMNFFVLENPAFLDAIGRGMGDRALIAGFTRRQRAGEGAIYFNSAAVIDGVAGAPRVSQIYDKHHLVPFGEYIPFWPVVSRIAAAFASIGVPLEIAPLQQIGAGFAAGAEPTRLVVPEAPTAVVLICYEAIFPGMTPRGSERPGWIVSVTNDAWFGEGAGPWQHFNIARYRAIEEGLPLVRAASGGVSAIVDAYGRSVRATHRRGGFAEAQLPGALPDTIYARWGFVLSPLVILLIAALRFVPASSPARGLRS